MQRATIPLPKKEESYWQSQARGPSYPALERDIRVDVAIVGGGITGLTAAYLLKQAGLAVAVIEKHSIGSGTTGKTTGKITSQHGLTYTRLIRRKGKRTARIYAEANQAALHEIADLIDRHGMDCDFRRADNYVFTADPEKTRQFRREAAAARELGLPAAFETELPLPFAVRAAVKFSGQAMCNAQKYVDELAKFVEGNGSHVFERSNVTGFHDGQPAVVTAGPAKVIANNIIVATKVPAAPLIARGAYAALERPHTSYIVAGKMSRRLSGMYISPDKEHYSILPVEDGKQRLLLIGGGHHIPGLGSARARYRRLAEYADRYFGVSSIRYKWKGMDYIAYDDMPLIGRVYPWSKHLYTATGFRKWGLTTSMVAGMILRDAILGVKNPWSAAFDSVRLAPVKSIPYVIANSFRR